MRVHSYPFKPEQITADLSSKTVQSEKGRKQYANHDDPDEDVKYRQKFERSKFQGTILQYNLDCAQAC